MADDKDQAPPFKVIKIEGCSEQYVDVSVVGATLYGFELNMGKRGEEVPNGVLEYYISMVAYMSPQHMKDMVCMLLNNIMVYEKKFGEINSQFVVENVRIRKRDGEVGPDLTPAGGIQA